MSQCIPQYEIVHFITIYLLTSLGIDCSETIRYVCIHAYSSSGRHVSDLNWENQFVQICLLMCLSCSALY